MPSKKKLSTKRLDHWFPQKFQEKFTEIDCYVAPHNKREDIAEKASTKPFKLPNTNNKTPVQMTRMSGAFSDYNKTFRKKRSQPIVSKYQNFNTWGNSKAKGKYHHDKMTKFEDKLKFKRKPDPKDRQLNTEAVEENEQIDTTGTEVRGFKKLDKRQAKINIKRDMVKDNRGNLFKSGGFYQAGRRFREYENETKRFDEKYIDIEAEPDEFSSLEKAFEQQRLRYSNNPNIKTGNLGI